MPYCSGCGSHYQEGDRVCKSCGFELNDDAPLPGVVKKAQLRKKNPQTRRQKKKVTSSKNKDTTSAPTIEPNVKIAEDERKVLTESVQSTETRQLQSEILNLLAESDEIHLGKGIIKPKAIERDVDGFHFKYEEQPQSLKKGTTFFVEQGAELHAVNPEFAAELPAEVSGRIDSVTNLVRNHSEKLEVAGNAYLFKNEAKPALATEPVDQPKTVLNSATTTSQDSMAKQDLDNMATDPLEAELRDLETALAEARQAEMDLVGEMEAAEKEFAKVTAEIEMTETDQQNEITEETANAAANGNAVDVTATKTDGINENPFETSTGPELGLVSEGSSDGEMKSAVPAENQLHQESSSKRKSGDLITLLQGQQSWYGIPLPYYYRLSERFLVCSDANGRSFEYDLTTINKITIKQSWLGKLLRVGDVVLDFTNQTPSRYILAGISNPTEMKAVLEELLQNIV